MLSCDVLIVGGGPAGSSCAWGLRQSGLEVVLIDRAEFPRDKTCAGWVTPPIWKMLDIDPHDYAPGRTLQPITGFKTGLFGDRLIETDYGEVVSYGIRRCEFDHYLLSRCGAQVRTGTPLHRMQRRGNQWIVNDEIRAALLVGAGGHFCPVARWLGIDQATAAPVVTAQEIEFELTEDDLAGVRAEGSIPELLFCRDLSGYGWCFRKGNFLNIGLGSTDPKQLKPWLARLTDQLLSQKTIARPVPGRLHGHAYRLACRDNRPVIGEGVVLLGDAAGLAQPQSGEGIRPAVESGLRAAQVILDAQGNYQTDRLAPYQDWIRQRDRAIGLPPRRGNLSTRLRVGLGRYLMQTRWFTRRILLDRWFLDRGRTSQ